MNGNCSANEVERYDPKLNTWHTCRPLITARKLHGIAAVGKRVFVFGGGGTDESILKSAEEYDVDEDVWRPIRDLPVEAYASAAAVGNVIYIFLWGKHVCKYDTCTGLYTQAGSLPLPEYFGFSTVAHEGNIYVLGGQTKGQRRAIAYRYDTAGDSWHPLPPMKIVRRRCAAVICEHRLVVQPADMKAPECAASAGADKLV